MVSALIVYSWVVFSMPERFANIAFEPFRYVCTAAPQPSPKSGDNGATGGLWYPTPTRPRTRSATPSCTGVKRPKIASGEEHGRGAENGAGRRMPPSLVLLQLPPEYLTRPFFIRKR